jgi:hypothetical protein
MTDELLVLTGAYFSILIAVLFVPAYLAMQEAAQAAVDTLVPLSDATFPNHEWFERQSDLRAFLGLDCRLWASSAPPLQCSPQSHRRCWPPTCRTWAASRVARKRTALAGQIE